MFLVEKGMDETCGRSNKKLCSCTNGRALKKEGSLICSGY